MLYKAAAAGSVKLGEMAHQGNRRDDLQQSLNLEENPRAEKNYIISTIIECSAH